MFNVGRVVVRNSLGFASASASARRSNEKDCIGELSINTFQLLRPPPRILFASHNKQNHIDILQVETCSTNPQIHVNMPTYLNLTLSLISQYDAMSLPEFHPPTSDANDPFSSHPALISESQPIVSVYIPTYPCSTFWLSYTISPPHPTKFSITSSSSSMERMLSVGAVGRRTITQGRPCSVCFVNLRVDSRGEC